jgi:serine/threonine protein kinase/Tol biopolymer transport system component
MRPERWQQIESVFQAALRSDGLSRTSFLDQVCSGDDELRSEVDSLLAAHERAGVFIGSPALEVAAGMMADEQSDSIREAIGPYKIISHLGAGGMSEVYLAEDPRLGRKVALKVLPGYFREDEERVRRFQQEARAASALNHPHVATIYEIGEADGVTYIAMEYVEGQTLSARIGGRPMPSAEIIEIAAQIAEALEEAHGAGITHRDIKSANIMMTARGKVKVLDFGLAKVAAGSPEGALPGDQTLPSWSESIGGIQTLSKTGAGMVMGTVPYMSPEQARGLAVDNRTDIFSLGVVIYEMVTGRLPFVGETVADVVAAILDREPPPLTFFGRSVPAPLESIIMKALRKDRQERYQAVSEMLSDLRELQHLPELETHLEHPQRGEAATPTEARELADVVNSTSTATASTVEIKQRKRALLWLAVAILAIGAFAIGGYRFARLAAHGQPSSSPPAIRITRLTAGSKVGTSAAKGAAAISPDGAYVFFATEEAGKVSFWLREVVSTGQRRVFGPAAGRYMGSTFSGDGAYVYFSWRDEANPTYTLYQMPIRGGPPRKLLSQVDSPITFSPSGDQFAFVRYGDSQGTCSLMVANSDGSGESTLATRQYPEYFNGSGPAWSPDGTIIACGVGTGAISSQTTVVAVPTGGGPARPLTTQKWENVFRAVWLADGTGLIVAASTGGFGAYGVRAQIWCISYPGGDVHRITNDLGGYGQMSLGLTADSATLVTLQEDYSSQVWVMPPNETSHARQISYGRYDGMHGLCWTPAGKIVYLAQEGDDMDLWMMNPDGTGNRQLTADPYLEFYPSVSRDGRYIVFVSNRTGVWNVWRADVDGSNPKQLTAGLTAANSPGCTPDGRWVVFESTESGKQAIWKVPIDGGTPAAVTSQYSSLPAISPDGKLIAYCHGDEQSNNHFALAIVPFAGGQPTRVFNLPYTFVPSRSGFCWTPDGRAVTYLDDGESVGNIWSQAIEGGPPKRLTDFRSGSIARFALSPDGKQIAIARNIITDDVILIRDFR